MPGLRVPGPKGMGEGLPNIDLDTLPRMDTPPPVPCGTDKLGSSSTGPGAGSGMQNEPEIEALDLAVVARSAAYALKKAHPTVKFTSGRRDKNDQARAMASNVVSNRKWIEETYRPSTLRTKCQEWVNKNPDKKTQTDIAEGLLSVFNATSADDLGKFSKHLSGEAFDVQPMEKNAEAIKTTIRGLPGLVKFLEKEGGLVRWHAEF